MWLPRLFRTRRAASDPRRAADAARARGDWSAAATAYRDLAALRPDEPAILVQLAHMLKEGGHRADAASAYRDAARRMPGDIDVRLHLAAMLRDDGAVDDAAAVFAEILAIDPAHAASLRALADLGERRRIPRASLSRAVHGAMLDAASEHVRAADRHAEDWLTTAAFPVTAYDLFRDRYPVPPPPGTVPADDTEILVLASGASAAMLHATLSALEDQAVPPTRVTVVADDTLRAHTIASPGSFGTAVRFVAADSPWQPTSTAVLLLGSGTIPCPQAIAWLAFARARTGRPVVYADHDHRMDDWRHGPFHSDPALFGAHDPLFLAATPEPPAMVLADANRMAAYPVDGPAAIWLRALTAGPDAIHVPRVLSSHYRLPEPAVHAPADGARTLNQPRTTAPPLPVPAESTRGAGIAVVIPTRDPDGAARGMVASLLRRAHRPDRVRCVLMDNGAAPSARKSDAVLTVPFAEPFNWSRANNLGARQAPDAPLLVFANDDMEMLSDGWDDAVERRLSDEYVGAMGAALVYRGGGYQHAGIVLGVGERTLAMHEGLGADEMTAGPGGRWTLPRAASAVTGAFLATRRSVFDRLGGFEERLGIAYNDIDFAFRAREAGLGIVYDPTVRLIHEESRTRGRNVTQAQVAWDEAELQWLARRWGAALRIEPGYNPQWALRGTPFDGYREPTMREVLRHIDLHSGGNPWRVTRAGQRGPESA